MNQAGEESRARGTEPASAVYRGVLRHRRVLPVPHTFSYPIFMMYLDLDELPELFDGRWLWSARGPAPAWFRRADYLGDPRRPLAEAVRDVVEERTGRRPSGRIRLLTHLRYFGYVMNPVSFYYCFAPSGTEVDAIVAEITNTPWNERHHYVLSSETLEEARPTARRVAGPRPGDHTHPVMGGAHRFRKEFHVSPFMEMELEYRWRFSDPGPTLTVHMENLRQDGTVFDATLTLHREEIGGRSLAGALARHPWMTVRVFTAIYGQAARLWWKRTPFFAHPRSLASRQTEEETSRR